MSDIAKKLVLPILFIVCFLAAQKVKQEYDKFVADYQATRDSVNRLIGETQQIAERINGVLDSLRRVRSLEGEIGEESMDFSTGRDSRDGNR